MSFRQIDRDPFQFTMKAGERGKTSISSQVSKVLSPMRNVDIERAAKTGNWDELMKKATRQMKWSKLSK